MIDFRLHGLLLGLVILIALAQPAAAFGAGNIASISKIEGQNWRHGDIEDALLSLAMARALNGKKFSKLMVARVYFGNWLRDYSQAIDVGTVKSVSAEAIRLLLCVLGFLTFGYGSGEFEVTADRLGCYRPEDHIDNPKDYADNIDARQYDRRLRGPIDERAELSIDPESGMKNYIANERANIMTSAQHVRNLFSRCIELARRYKDSNDKADFYESLRLMGTGLHCLEDFFAHSNYIELALVEMGERDVFPHCGSNTRIRLEGARGGVYPIVTGTFGGVDFLHSVTGEVSDKLSQNEIEELEGTLQESKNADTSLLRDLLDKIPDGIFGESNQAQKIDEIQSNANAAQVENTSVSPRDPEEFTVYVQNIFAQIMPAIKFHDDIMKGIDAAIGKIPVLPKIVEQLEEQLSKFVFSIIAPFIVPLIRQIRNELKTGSSEIIKSSEREQHAVFNNDSSSDPTHSMLSKDHFSNILNEIAGRSAAKMLHWVVPQIMDAIDDNNTDVNRLCDRIIAGVLHHPAQRDMGQDGAREARGLIFQSVEEWWNSMGDGQRQDYRRKLSRDGVQNGENHKEGVYDTGHGHGCSGKLEMRKLYGEPETLETKIAGAAADAIFKGATGAVSSFIESNTGMKLPSSGKKEEEKSEGGLGGFLSTASNILGGAFNKDETHKETSSRREDDGSYTQTTTEYGHHGNRYEQAEQSHTYRPDGSQQIKTSRYQQEDSNNGRQTSGYGYTQQSEVQPSYGGGQEQRTQYQEYSGSTGGSYGSRREDSSYGSQRQDDYGRREDSYGSQRQDSSYGSQRQDNYGGGREEKYGGGREDSYGSQRQDNYGSQRQDNYGSQRQDNYGSQRQDNYGGRREDNYGNQRQESYGSRREDSYGSQRQESYGGRNEGGYGGGGGYGDGYGSSEHGSRRSHGDDNSGYPGSGRRHGGDNERRRDSEDSGDDRRRPRNHHGRRKSDDSDKDRRRRHDKSDSGDSDDDRRRRYGR